MLREAMNWLVNNVNSVEEVEGKSFIKKSNGDYMRVLPDKAEPLCISTLKGVVDYINDDVDLCSTKTLIVVVKNERLVEVFNETDALKLRDFHIESHAALPEVHLERYMPLENFIIQLQAVFVKNEDRDKILKLIGNIRSESVKNQSDNGITQTVEVRQGIADVGLSTVPNPVVLKPYRTFTEIIQPESEFVLRLREGREGVEAALFEADGGAWKNEARLSIKEYIEEHIELAGGITIIS